MPNTNDSLTGLNVELVGASKQEFTLLTENHLMRRIIVALSELMRNAEGVMIDSHVYPWDQVLPAAMDIPSSNASDEEIQNWMISACKEWQCEYNRRVQSFTASEVKSKSDTENDNLFLLNITNLAHMLMDRLLPFVSIEEINHEDPDLLPQVIDIVNYMVGVINGTTSTQQVRQELFTAGADDAVFALKLKHKELTSRGEDAGWLEEAMKIIEENKRQSIDFMQRS